MAIKVVPYEARHESAVAKFNQRMAEGDTGWGWYERSTDVWLPDRGDDPHVWVAPHQLRDGNDSGQSLISPCLSVASATLTPSPLLLAV